MDAAAEIGRNPVSKHQIQPELLLLLLLLFLTFSALVANPKKTTLHGGQSRSWSAEQGKKRKRKSLAAQSMENEKADAGRDG